ncbi:hypothetical protein, partial [Rhodanobacter caeni]|uniref:hypothetical protein n=1 Tax=Rhodanobacter caeni TaxID=657654 RepID=UPI0031CF5FF7
AADSGLPHAQAAWELFDSRSVKPSGASAYNNFPNFALLPRSAAYDPVTSGPVTNVPPPSETVPPADVPPPVVSPPSESQAEVSQSLTASQAVIKVGDTFTVSGTLHYLVGMTKPVTGYRLYGFDSKVLSATNSYTPRFVANAVGTTQIRNDNSGTTGVITITVVAATPVEPAKVTAVGQSLTASRKVITVGDTFTLSATVHYSDGTSKPSTAYRLYGFDKTVVSAPNSYTPTFVATAAGITRIKNDNSGVTGQMDIVVVAAQ